MSLSILDKAEHVIQKNLRKPTRLEKASFTSTDLSTGGGLLAPQQARRFVQLIRYNPELLKYIRMSTMRGPTERIDRLTFASRILHTSTEGTALAASLQANPTGSKVELSTSEFTAEIPLTYNVLQDSIEGDDKVRGNKFEDTIFQMIASKIAEDVEEIALLSDSSDASLHADLQQFDGWLKKARDQNSYDHGGSAINKALFKQMHLSLPKAYRKNKSALRFIISPNTDIEWADEQADRTTTTGDAVPWGDRHPSRAYGMPTIVSGYMPEESGSSSNLGQILHTHPKNMILGIWRNIFLEVDRDIRARSLIVVATIRIAVEFEQVEGATVGTNIKVS